MNRSIRRVWIACAVMLSLLLANISYGFVFRHDALSKNPYNRRVQIEAFAQNRGSIMAGGVTLAYSEPVNDPFKYQRKYNTGPVYAPVTGWFTYNYGTSGLEGAYNTDMSGTSDSLVLSRMIDELGGKIPRGASIETTIDPTLQQAAYDALGPRTGAVVVMDPKTGAILAMASTPSHDPNALATHDLPAAQQAWEAGNADPSKPLVNRAAREIYPPGSTFKLIVSAAALENGFNPDTQVETPGKLRLPGTTVDLPNVSPQCTGTMTMQRAMELSCNTAFANVGMKVGEDKLVAKARQFGFGTSPLPDLGAAASRMPTGMNQAQVAQSSIGQYDVAASPLQMAMVGSAIANDGKLMTPYLVKDVRGPNLTILRSTKPSVMSTPLSPDNAGKMRTMMKGVVTNGLSTNLPWGNSSVDLMAKTGTAEHGDGLPYGWMVAIAQQGDRQLVVAVFIEDSPNANPNDVFSITNESTPVAQQVLKAAFK